VNELTGKSMKVHQAIARALTDNGVDTMFGLCGDANMFMVDSFVHDCGGTFVSTSHEVGAALMALGYASAADKVGICSVTFGPAMTVARSITRRSASGGFTRARCARPAAAAGR